MEVDKVRTSWNKGKKTPIETILKQRKANIGKVRTEEMRQRYSLSKRGNLNPMYKKDFTSEHRKRLSDSLKNKIMTEEHKDKLRLANKGQVPWILGKKHSDETKIKMSIKKKGKPNWNKGKQLSEEWKQKIRESNLGKKRTKITKDKIKLARLKQIIPSKDTSIEVALQKELTNKNIQFLKHKAIMGQPDIFIEPNICIFADGDYWHNIPKAIERDKKVNEELTKQGFKVYRFWEHQIKKDVISCINEIGDING